VPREEIESAVSLNGISINLARALGPALGGVVVAAAGAGPTFLLNAASFGVVIGALALWRREPSPTRLPPEDLIGAMRAGLRFARYSGPLRLVLARVAAFVLPASAIWALLPLYARQEMGLGAAGYGVLLGCFGSGAVAGGVALPRLRAALGAQRLTTAAALAFAAANGVLGASSAFAAVAPALAVAGACWIAILSTLSAMAQLALPAWVRARGLSLSLLVTFGGLALGSAVWGGLAEAIGLPRTFLAAGAAVAASRLFVWRLRLPEGEGPDLTPAPRWPDPQLATSLDLRRGPVLVTVEYEVAPDEAPAFARAMDELRQIRLRDGAIRWGLWSDTGRPERQLESFVVESWVEHLRQHERITSADRAVQARIHAFHRGAAPPRVTHYVSEAVPSGR
jgi:predicted MFS family arabinose efflux permease